MLDVRSGNSGNAATGMHDLLRSLHDVFQLLQQFVVLRRQSDIVSAARLHVLRQQHTTAHVCSGKRPLADY
jgi:hypothetical protein